MKSQSSRSVYVPSLILKYIECSSCSKRFHVKCNQELRSKSAYLLNCGHSVCDLCYQKVGTTVISCKTCHTPALTARTNDSVQTLQKNAYLIGRACMANRQVVKESFSYCVLQKLPKNLAKQSNGSINSYLCYECSVKEATLNCQQCECNYCGECWVKVHSSGKSLMRHIAVNIKSGNKTENTKHCEKHIAKPFELFCENCKSYLCADCVPTDHETHKIQLLKEKNYALLNIVFKVKNELQQHIAKMEETAKRVKQLRETALIQGSSYATLQRQVVQHFVHLHGVLQVAEESLLQKLKNAENSSVFRLEEILIQLETQIRGCKRLVKEAQDARVSDNIECCIALEDLLENMNSAVGLPVHLANSGPEEPLPNQAPLVSFNESVVDALRNFCTLNIPEDNLYELRVCDRLEKITPKDVTAVGDVTKPDNSSAHDAEGSDTTGPKKSVPFLAPQATTKSLQSIIKGQPYSVNICYVKDPGEFYVIRSSMRRHQKKLDDRASNTALQCIIPKEVEKDEYYLVHYTANKNWYRGRAISVTPPTNNQDEPTVLIYYIDYGNTESVPLSRLRIMPQQLKIDAPMALKCRLFECTPKKGTWCKASTKAMLEVLNNTVLTMYVMKILPDGLEVDLCCRNRDDLVDSTLVSLRDTLVFLEYANFVSGPVRPRRALDANYLSQNLPKPGDTFSGIISHVVSPTRFYLQKIGPENEYLIQLTEKLNSTYDKNSQKFLIYNPIIGMICSALYPADGKWYRAEIADLPGNEMVKVFFVDFGDEECVPWKCVRKLLPEFVRLVPQALRCSLSKVLHPSGLKWSSKAKAYLENCTSDILTVHVASVTQNELKVVLLTKNNDCLNAELACADTAGEEPLGAEEKTLSEPELISPKSKNSILPNSEDEHQEDVSDGYRMEVRILRVESPSDILVSIVCLEAKSEKLEGELQRFYKTSKPVNGAWQAGSKCAVLSQERKKWYRGCILEVLEDGKFRVELKDIGQVEDVQSSNIRALAHRFLECPVSIMKCHLSGIFPPETEWPGLTCDFLISEVKNHNRVYITKADDNVNGSVPVVLWVKEVTNSGALEPSREEWISLNDLIVDQGLAVPAKAKLIFHKLESLESFTKAAPVKKEKEKSDSSNVDSDSSIPSIASRDWIQPKPILKREFMGKPTFVDFEGVISMYDIEDDGPVLEMIKNTLLEHYQNSEPKAQDQSWSVDQICVVKYYLDDCWYRGKVVKVNDNNTYSVLFVDYGNIEVCQVSEMRKNVKFCDIPVLSRKYRLHGVTPVSSDGRWPSDTVDSLYSAIVDITCKIKIVQKSNDPSVPSTIQLKLTTGDLDVAKILELASLASYNRLGLDEYEDAPQNQQKQRSYFNLELPPHCTSFPIDVLTVRLSSLSAHIVNNETVLPEIRKIICEFIDLTEDIQNHAESQPHLEQFIKGAPCISLYADNGKWYRAEVLNKSDDSNSILVHYVDYGNREYVTKDRIRQCQPKWFTFPKMSLKCKLHNVRKSVNITNREYIQSLTKCLSEYDLEATLIRKCDDYFEVEIWKNQQLAYQTMIEEGLMEFITKV